MGNITVSCNDAFRFGVYFDGDPTETYYPCTFAEAVRKLQQAGRLDMETARRVVVEAACTNSAAIEAGTPPLADVISGLVPAGFPVYVVGQDGVGTTTLLTDWIARVTTGTEMPNGQPTPEGSVLVAMPEYLPATMVERARAAGADLSKVHFLSGDFSIPERLPYLRRKIAETGARLVVFDPLGAVVHGNLYRMDLLDPRARAVVAHEVTDALAELAAVEKIGVLAAISLPKSMTDSEDHHGPSLFGEEDGHVFLSVTNERDEPAVKTVRVERWLGRTAEDAGAQTHFAIAGDAPHPHVEYLYPH